jgi:hypothetical protein
MKAAGEDDDKDTSLFQIPGINQPHSYVPDMVEGKHDPYAALQPSPSAHTRLSIYPKLGCHSRPVFADSTHVVFAVRADETHLHEAVKFAGIEPFWRTKVNARRPAAADDISLLKIFQYHEWLIAAGICLADCWNLCSAEMASETTCWPRAVLMDNKSCS